MKIGKWSIWLLIVLALSHTGGIAQVPEHSGICLSVSVYYEGQIPVDSALIKIYDQNNHFLCERLSNSLLAGFNFIQDAAIIKEYGTYYAEVSKKGYKTVRTEVTVEDRADNVSPWVILVPDPESDRSWGWGIVLTLVLVSCLLFLGYRKYKMRRS